MKAYTKLNQHGAALLMFAMVMIIVLSLIAVGFAFLVRNDQRQTLDKTLSNQAIYAAETAINRKAKQLKDGTELTKTKSDCSGATTDYFGATFSDVQITCLNWDAEPEVISISNIDESPKNVKVKPKSGTVEYFAVLWRPKQPCASNTTWGQYLNTLRTPTACPYLKISMSDAATVYSGNGRGTVVYSRAQSDSSAFPSSTNTYSYPEQIAAAPQYGGQQIGNPSGEIDNTFCWNGTCLIRIPVPNGASWTNANTGLISFSAIGGDIDVDLSAYTSVFSFADTSTFFPGNSLAPQTPVLKTTNRAQLIEAQAIIDATAKANDVIKRVRVSVPISEDTWKPGFGVLSNTICKNYRLDGNGASANTTAGPADTTACY